MKRIIQTFIAALMLAIPCASTANTLVETESFKNKGGWRSDHQAFPKIGSAYLLAQGYGRPVKDATTVVKFDEAATYHVYVSTYNWTAPWYDGKGPGSFQLMVNNKPMANTLGDEGKAWGWQYAGEVKVKAGNNNLALHDLTGFGGRADAIYFSKEKKTPLSELEKLHQFRREELGFLKPKECGNYDLVVVGGGVAGCATALSAARYGLKVAIVDNLPGLGGNHYLHVKLCGVINENLYPQLGNMVRQLSGLPIPQNEEELKNEPHKKHYGGGGNLLNVPNPASVLAKLRRELLEEAGVKVFQSVHAYQVEMKKNKVAAVVGKSLLTGEDMIFRGTLFSDCTGDGVVGYLAGADFRIGREAKSETNEPMAPEVADQKKMGSTLWWGAKDVETETTFPTLKEMPWAMQCSAEYHKDVVKGGWFWETGLELNNAEEMELVRDNLVRAIYGNWAYLKEAYPDKYKNHQIVNLTHIGMKRESRRLMGDIVLNQNDIINRVEYPDASFTTTWTFDLHYAEEANSKAFPGWEWIATTTSDHGKSSWVKPSYHVPYRILYSRNIDNLFIGGRAMSTTHVALGTVRVMATLGMAGEVTGMAAKICIDNKTNPRGVYEKHLPKLKEYMTKGAPLK
ncbi:MAG: FAD-dependent oxidoreductase [Rikenellaceae bacterium]